MMVGFMITTVLAILLIFVYSLMHIASDADEQSERMYHSRNG